MKSDPEYNCEWPGLWGHFVSNRTDEEQAHVHDLELGWADDALDAVIEETRIDRARRKSALKY